LGPQKIGGIKTLKLLTSVTNILTILHGLSKKVNFYTLKKRKK